MSDPTNPSNLILKRLYPDEQIIISACNSEETLPSDKSLFKGFLSSDFASWEDEPGLILPETHALVYEVQKGLEFKPMFYEVSTDLDQLHWSKKQIKKFVLHHADRLQPRGWSTFFLYKKMNDYFVVAVRFLGPAGREIHVSRIENDPPWYADHHERVVVPGLQGLAPYHLSHLSL